MIPIRFGTDGWRAIIAKDYTFDNLARIAYATALWLKDQYQQPKVVLGYDCRFMARDFARCVAAVLAQEGIQVLLSTTFTTTPMISYAVQKEKAQAGIILTASHNPPQYAGYKVKGYYGGPATPEMTKAIEKNIPEKYAIEDYEKVFQHFYDQGQIKDYEAEKFYEDYLRERFSIEDLQNSGFRIAYDAMYGAGQRLFPRLFPKAHLLHCHYNPWFDGIPPEPIEKNLMPLKVLARRHRIHFALATDGDADRLGLFDQYGFFVDSHHILLLLIRYLHEHKGLKGRVICSFSCTTKIHLLCEKYQLPLTVTPVGFKHIVKAMQESKEPILVAGEESGGITIQGHIPERDGIFIGLTLLEMMTTLEKDLPQLIDELYDLIGPFAMRRKDLHLPESQKQAIIEACKRGDFTQFDGYKVQQVETIDGFKFHLDDEQWVMIRPSGTEPLLRVYAQGKDAGSVQDIIEKTIATILK